MSTKTDEQYSRQIMKCRDIFVKKTHDYGTSWRILRLRSLVDQIYIKAQRIRSIEEKQTQKVDDPVEGEFIGIINYCIIALIQLEMGTDDSDKLAAKEIIELYDKHYNKAKFLMEAKNHDYGEAWRNMYISSFTDLILMKLMRMRQILDLEGNTLISEGLDANLFDMINYATFALIKIEEENERS